MPANRGRKNGDSLRGNCAKHLNALIALFLAVITATLYARVRQYGFANLDDPAYVMENTHVLGGLRWANLVWAFTHVILGNWHPLTTLSLMLDATVFGNWAGGFHVTNVVMHSLNTVLLFLLLERMTGALWRSALVAALFAWHPLHVEPVAWISSRKDVLSTLFMMLAMMAYVRYAATRRRGPYLLVLVLFALGLMAKPMLVTLPFLLLLLDYWPLGRLRLGQNMPAPPGSGSSTQPVPLKALVLEKVPLLLVSAVFSVVAFIAQGDAVSSLQQFPLSVRLANIPISYVRYLRKLFWPDDLAIFYPYPLGVRFLLTTSAICFLLMVTLWVIEKGKTEPYLPVGWLWFLGALVPVIGIIQLGAQAMADRYTYISLTGLFIMAAWLIPSPKLPLLKGFTVAGVSAVLIGCMVATCFQLTYWKDSISLFTRDLAVTSSNSLAHYNLALALAAHGDTDDAIEHFELTVKASPGLPTAWNNLGIAYFQKGRLDKAADDFRKALEVKPEFADAHNNLANILEIQGRLDEAINEYKAALRIEPAHFNAERNLRKAFELKQQQLQK